MLKRDVLHSLNASALHADCSAADGLNSAYAEAGNAKIARQKGAVTAVTKTPRDSPGPPGQRPNYPWNEWP